MFSSQVQFWKNLWLKKAALDNMSYCVASLGSLARKIKGNLGTYTRAKYEEFDRPYTKSKNINCLIIKHEFSICNRAIFPTG